MTSGTAAPAAEGVAPLRALLQHLQRQPRGIDDLAACLACSPAQVHGLLQAAAEAGVPLAQHEGRFALDAPLEWLQAERIMQALQPQVRAALASLRVAWEVASTNTVLLQRQDTAGLHVLLAERQTAGRGRRGRAWQSPLAAQLALSLAGHTRRPVAEWPGLSLVAGVAVVQALHGLGVTRAGLKWPNDVLAQGRKLGGILVEGRGRGGHGPARVVIGIGLNVRLPAGMARAIDQPWTDLHALGHAVSRHALAVAVLDALVPALAQFEQHGLAPFVQAYARHDVLQGRPVQVQSGADGPRCGIAMGIAADGGLRVVDAEGSPWTVHAGEVSVRAHSSG